MRRFKAEMFKALGHPTRLGILEHLRDGELTVSELQARLEIEATVVSQQLAVLRAQRLVAGRKEGTSVYYRAVDPQIFTILALAREIFANHMHELQAVADEEPSSAPPEALVGRGGMVDGDSAARGV
jgi:DNA-binding transcriptional ArsR family regulator